MSVSIARDTSDGVVDFPVVVVGAGPTGLLTANLLGMAGIKTLLIEKASGISSLPKAILIDDEALRSVQAIGLIEELKKGLVMGYGAKYYSPDGECFATIDPQEQLYGYSMRNSFLQPDLESVLLKGLKRFPCVKTLFNTELTSLDNGERRATVSLTTSEGERKVFTALCVLACDGAKSTIRKCLGIELEGTTYAQDWIVIDTINDPDKDKFSKFYCDHIRPGVSIPAPHGGRRYEFRMMDGENKNDVTQTKFMKQLLRRFREIDDNDITRATVYTFHAKMVNTLCDNRVVLLGDAAHLTPPFAGQGMNAGLRDAHNVAWKAVLLVQGKADISILETYQAERRDPIWSMIEYAVALGNFVMPANQLRGEIVRILIDMLSIVPDFRDYVLNMKFKPKTEYKEGIIVKAEDPEDLLVGRLLPQPLVMCREAKNFSLMDDFLGEGFSILTFDIQTYIELKSRNDIDVSDLQAKVICVVADIDEILAVHECPGTILICNDENFSEIINKYRGRSLFIRPDRYVAGVFVLSDIESFQTELMRTMTGAM